MMGKMLFYQFSNGSYFYTFSCFPSMPYCLPKNNDPYSESGIDQILRTVTEREN